MEVVQDEEAGPSGSTFVEYEMTPDADGAAGVASMQGGEVDQAMDDAAQSDVAAGEEGAEGMQNEGEAYEVMMEEYAEEEEEDNHDDGQREMEEEAVTYTHEQQEEENQTAADYTGEGSAAAQQQHEIEGEEEGEGEIEGEEEEDAMDGTTVTHEGDDDEHDGDNDGTDYQENDENDEDGQEAGEPATVQGAAEVAEEAGIVEAASHDEHDEAAAQKEGGEEEEEYTPERNETSDGDHKETAAGATESVAGVSQEGTVVETEGEQRQAGTEEAKEEAAAAVEPESSEPLKPAEVSYDGEEEEGVVEVGEDSDEVDAPPPIRVTFNGQDFVLFPQSEVSSYTTATEAEPVAAPQLKADAGIFFDSLDSLFQALRVKDSLGDFLEEGSELQISFVDLDLILREDDVYAREVTLNDIHRIHMGYGLSSSLHMDISEKARFITRYNDLAAHVSSAVDEQTVEDAEGPSTDAAQEGDDAAVQESGEADQQEAGNEAEEHVEEESREAAGEVDGEGNAEDAAEGEGETEKGDVTSAVDETFITVNETADETAEETEDIVDYDEAYHNGENGEAQDDTGADAEYEENGYGEEDGEEEEQAYEEEEKRDSIQARQKRSLDDGNDGEEAVASTEYEEGDAKRVKVDG